MAEWRYFATTLHGDGTETLLSSDVPLTDVSITKTLSGVDALDASLPVELAHLKDDNGAPIFREWSTALYAEKDGFIRAGVILQSMTVEDGRVTLHGEGFAGYINGMPYEGDVSYIDADPLVIARHIWEHAQSFDGGNIPVVLDTTTSPVRIGTEEREVDFQTQEGETVQFESGPYRLNFWSTHNLGGEFEALSEETPFDWREHHEWVGDTIRHRIELGYPELGAHRDDMRFVYGENVVVPLRMDFNGEDYASEVVVLGAGEGRTMIRQRSKVATLQRLRRVTVIQAKEASSGRRARSIADAELIYRYGDGDVASVVVRDHDNAPIAAIQPGDWILVQNHGGGWGGDAFLWVRVLEISYSPEEGDTATLAVTRQERTAL